MRSRFSTGTIPQASLASPSSTNQSAHQPILHRLIPSSVSEEENVAIQTQTISRITGIQPENQQDMLKFVRKLDTDSVSSTSNNSSTTTATTRVSMDQNRHLQVTKKLFIRLLIRVIFFHSYFYFVLIFVL